MNTEEYERHQSQKLFEMRLANHERHQKQRLLEMRLNKSMRTQTESLPKPSYKDRPKETSV